MNQTPIRVLVADGHEVARLGIRAVLVDAEDVEIVGEAGDSREVAAAAERLRPDVILMDLVMPGGMDGVEAIRTIRERQSDAKIVILTDTAVAEVILAAVRAGAMATSPETPPRDPLTKSEVAVLRQVAKGRSNQEVADEIHVSEGTVRTHMTRILSKLGVKNRVQATLYALRSGLATLDEDD